MQTLQTDNEIHVQTDRGLGDIAGWRGAAVATGVKPSGALDLAVLVADEPMCAAGVFTRNRMAAAPVNVSRSKLESKARVRSIVINAGNANALTGQQGEADAKRMVEKLELCCGGPGIVLSTGVIGVPLPVDRVCDGIEQAAGQLGGMFEADVAQAILTTDKCSKLAYVGFGTSEGDFAVGGIAKGSGMIHPNMATMLAVVATDAPVEEATLRSMLTEAVDDSFHRISVDGDTSTNDAVILLSREVSASSPSLSDSALDELQRSVTRVCQSLASQIVDDGEGATKVMEVVVSGAASSDDGHRIATAIACSSLVKTALAGGDPNWGRILSAAGNAGVSVDPMRVTLWLGDEMVFRTGEVLSVEDSVLEHVFAAKRVNVRLDVGMGDAGGRRLTTDLSKDYVAINADYTT